MRSKGINIFLDRVLSLRKKIRRAEADLYLKWNGDREMKTQLPPDYVELEKRVDALKQVHQKMLSVT